MTPQNGEKKTLKFPNKFKVFTKRQAKGFIEDGCFNDGVLKVQFNLDDETLRRVFTAK